MSSPQASVYGQSYSHYSMATSQGYSPSTSPQQPPPPPPPQFDNQRARSPDIGDKGRGFNPQYVPSYTRDENNLLRQPPPPPPPPAPGRSRTFWSWEGHFEIICYVFIFQRRVFSTLKIIMKGASVLLHKCLKRSCGGIKMLCVHGVRFWLWTKRQQ
jgi:hypothetical protein